MWISLRLRENASLKVFKIETAEETEDTEYVQNPSAHVVTSYAG